MIKLGLTLLLVILLGGIPLRVAAQQTVFNVPSADVMPEGEVFLQHESQFRPYDPSAFWGGTHYAAVGVGHHTEVDATLFNTSAPGSQNVSLGLGIKTALPLFAKTYPNREIKVTLGQMLPVSLDGVGVGSWSYSHLSGRLPKLNTRITAGVSYGTQQIFGRDALSMMAALEQPVTNRVSLIADWYSGTHALGLLITGVSFSMPKSKSALYLGWQTPNNRESGVSGFVFELAKYF